MKESPARKKRPESPAQLSLVPAPERKERRPAPIPAPAPVPVPVPDPVPAPKAARRASAEKMATRQREISVSEFFMKNRHLLGFDNPSKALLTAVKEAVDNSLDACEEAGILPEIAVEVIPIFAPGAKGPDGGPPSPIATDRYRIMVEDNGPGIVKNQIPKVFGQLLYGSKFHRLRQSLTADQKVLVERRGHVDRLPIGDLVDDLLAPGQEVREVTGLGLRAPAFDLATWRYEWRDVSHVIRHPRANEILEVRTEGGKRIRVTGCHSLFTYDSSTRQVREIEARVLRPGDFVVAPRRLPEPSRYAQINLLDHLAEADIAGRWIYVYGISPALLRRLRASARVVHRKGPDARSRRFYLLRDASGAEVEILDDSWTQYERKGFLPVTLVKRLGVELECASCSLRTYHHGVVSETPATWALTPALMRLLGLYVAEGHSDLRQIGFTFSIREQHLVEEIVSTARGLGLSTTVEPRPRNAVRVKVFGCATDVVFPAWCRRGAKNKRVPEFVFHASRELRQHFLDALYQGDGHKVKGRDVLMFSSVSRALIEDVELLWLLQGVVARRSGPRRQQGLGRWPPVSWHLDVYGADIAASNVYERRAANERANRYRMFPVAKLALAGGSSRTRVPATPEAIVQAAGLGLGPAGASKSLRIVMGVESDRTYALGELASLAGARVTRHLTAHMAKTGYLDADSDGYRATGKIDDLRREIAAVRSFHTSDLCLLRVESVRRVRSKNPFVYDLSVPGCENFVAGEGALACHNSRGQQGIGISAAGMYGLLTTGKPVIVVSRTGEKKPAHHFEITIDHKKNAPVVHRDEELSEWHRPHGTRVEIELQGDYKHGQRSLTRYIEMTALANPHAAVTYLRPNAPPLRFPRSSDTLPKEPLEIRPHPHGVELGALMALLKDTKAHNIRTFLKSEFSRVSETAAREILEKAGLEGELRARRLGREEAEALHRAMTGAKLMAPPTNCLSPIGDELMRKGLITFLSVVEEDGEEPEADAQRSLIADAQAAEAQQAEPAGEGVERIRGKRYFITTVTRPPRVYRGNPFQVEVGLAFGGDWATDKTIELYRFANRVPLLFQRSACAATEAVIRTDWKNYLLSQPKGSLPVGPMALMVHLASVWVPFTSEAKEALAHYPEIVKEIQLAAQECGRKLAAHIRKRQHADYEAKRRSIFELYIKELGESLERLTGTERARVEKEFLKLAQELTAVAGEEAPAEDES